jgi:AraC-like DNA-binding protein
MDDQGFYSWPFDSLSPVDVRFYMFNKRTNLRLNRHDYFEVLYVSHGEITFQIHRQNFNVRAGDMIVVGSSLFHRPNKYGSAPTKAIALYFLPKAVLGTESDGEDAEYLMPFLVQDIGFPHLVAAKTGVPAKVLELIKLINAELPAKSIRDRLNVKTYLKMILVLLGNHYADYNVGFRRFRRKEDNIKRLRPVLDFLDEHFPERITVDDAAKMVHMSKSHFIRFFVNVIGQTFVIYINDLRVAKAERLLAATDIPIAELCQQVGFCDQSYFGKVFRKSTGTSPGEYRRKFSGANIGEVIKQELAGGGPTIFGPDNRPAFEKRPPNALLETVRANEREGRRICPMIFSSGLGFPEGPVVPQDGSWLLVERERGAT